MHPCWIKHDSNTYYHLWFGSSYLLKSFIFEGKVPANQKHVEHLYKLGQEGPSVLIIARIVWLYCVNMLNSICVPY